MKTIVVIPSSHEDTLVIKEEELEKFPITTYHSIPHIGGRISGNCVGKAIYLDSCYNWQLVKDSEEAIVLIAMKKNELKG